MKCVVSYWMTCRPLTKSTMRNTATLKSTPELHSTRWRIKCRLSVPELTDFSDEPQHILDLYGPDVHRKGSFAYNCLMARRLAERDVRFIQCMHAGWDQHTNLNHQLKIQCQDTDQASAALVKDLKQRGNVRRYLGHLGW